MVPNTLSMDVVLKNQSNIFCGLCVILKMGASARIQMSWWIQIYLRPLKGMNQEVGRPVLM